LLPSSSPRHRRRAQPESAKNNLASTYVNAWVNAGFGQDKLVTPADSMWVFRNKDSGLMAAAASLGLVNLWDETKLDALDKYLNADDEMVRAGAGEEMRGGAERGSSFSRI
jgi:26S proteasome regulatory subunit N1